MGEARGTMSDHEEIKGLLAAYALDALDPDDSALVQAHLPGCRACRRELAGFLRVTDQVALGAAQASSPPSAPRPNVEERIIREASLMGARRTTRPARTWHPGFAMAAGALILLLAAANLVQWVHSPRFEAQSRGLVTVALTGTSRHDGAYGTIVVDMEDSEGVLAVRGLPRLSPDSRYQLWLKKDGEAKSGGLFTVDDDGYGSLLVKAPGGFKGFQAFSVSVEPAEGSVSPRGAPVLSGGL